MMRALLLALPLVIIIAVVGANITYNRSRTVTLVDIVNGPPPTDADGRDVLFDGTSLAGWRNYGGAPGSITKWQIDGDELVASQPGFLNWWGLARSQVIGGGNDDLVFARADYSTFELSFEWKVPARGNSGVFVLVTDETAKTASRSGFEYQVLDNDGHSDGDDPITSAGAIYKLVPPSPGAAKPAGEWNNAQVIVSTSGITHMLNGQLVVKLVRSSPEWDALDDPRIAAWEANGAPPAGSIVLQDHGDEVRYRNIKVRRLD